MSAEGPGFSTVSFLSDFGLADEFVGVVKAVIRSIAPHVLVLDISHDVPAYDVRAGALALARSIQYLPPGVVLAVVDPGVGSDRRAVAVEVGGEDGTDRAVLVGPDNGLLASAVALAGGAKRAVSLTNPAYHLDAPGPTFAGRDIFAPAVAHLCLGTDLEELGDLVDPYSLVPGLVPLSRMEDGVLNAEVLWVDRFGNAQLNIGPDEVKEMGDRLFLRLGGTVAPQPPRLAVRVSSYSELKTGQVGLVVDSYGLLAVTLNRRPAADELRLGAGDIVALEPAPD
ncbi:MAG: S-adenosyl-l-methionine hydroxide adenosyltransferase family protein [Acidimicrobiales bacterium]|nr:SAM-dependent chlorinase/fluorinase [Actinomycetota bacterium]